MDRDSAQTTMPDAIRHAIIGVTGRGTNHIGHVEQLDDVDLVAGADVSPPYVEEFEAEYDLPGYTDHEEMLDAEEIDSVSICTPNGTHADISIDCMEAGADVLVEKPMDVYLDRVDAMVETAEAYDRKLACIFQRRFTPERWTLKEWVEEGRFGEMILADTTVKWHRPQHYYDDGWHGSRDLDGGVLLQQAVHFVDLLQWLMGGVEEVSANLATLDHEMECEDTAVLNLTFENGALGCLEATTAVNGGEDRLELNGTQGSFNSGSFVLDGEEVEPELTEPPCGTGMAGQIRDFFDAIREDRAPIVDGAEARDAIELVMAAYASDAIDRPVRLDEVRELEEHT